VRRPDDGRRRSVDEKAAIAGALLKNVWPLSASKNWSCCPRPSFPFSEAKAAHELMESSGHIGKIVLKVK